MANGKWTRQLTAYTRLQLFVRSEIRPTEEQLDQWIDEVVGLLEEVNDAKIPDALGVEDES